MLSIIICSKDPKLYDRLEKNIQRTIGIEFELIRINNEQYSVAAAYNKGIEQAQGDILLFLHETVLFVTRDWGRILTNAFRDPEVVGVGIAGSEILPANNTWFHAGQPNIHGHIIYPYDLIYDVEIGFAPNFASSQVVVLDGVFIAARAADAKVLQFDAENFPKSDYDVDFTLRLSQRGKILIHNILLKHFSKREFAKKYTHNPAFQQKHGAILPYKLKAELTVNPEAEYYRRLIPKLYFEEE